MRGPRICEVFVYLWSYIWEVPVYVRLLYACGLIYERSSFM